MFAEIFIQLQVNLFVNQSNSHFCVTSYALQILATAIIIIIITVIVVGVECVALVLLLLLLLFLCCISRCLIVSLGVQLGNVPGTACMLHCRIIVIHFQI